MGSGSALARAARPRMVRVENVDECILMGKRRPGGFCSVWYMFEFEKR